MKPYNVSGSIVPCPTLKLQFDGFLFSKKKSTKIKYLTCSLFFCILPIWWFVEGEKNHKCTQCAYWLPNDFQSRLHFALWSSLYCQTIKTILPYCTNTLIWNSLSWCDIIWSGVTETTLLTQKKPPCATTCRLHDRYNLVRRWHLPRDIHRYAEPLGKVPEPGGALWPDNWTKPPPAKLLLHSQKKGRYQFLILWTWCWCLRQVFDQATR